MKKTKLSTVVKTLRKEYGLTQEDLALKSGVGLCFVRNLEQGKPTLRMGEWMDIQTKRNEEKGKRIKGTSKREQTETCFQYAEREYLLRSQKSIGSSGQNMPKLTNVDSITIAKHKNGKLYLRVRLKRAASHLGFLVCHGSGRMTALGWPPRNSGSSLRDSRSETLGIRLLCYQSTDC